MPLPKLADPNPLPPQEPRRYCRFCRTSLDLSERAWGCCADCEATAEWGS
jgi:hypothetical protein